MSAIPDPKYRPGNFPKICACGRKYMTAEEWKQLPYAGIWPGTDDTTGKKFGPDLEMRNCHCQSSIMVSIES